MLRTVGELNLLTYRNLVILQGIFFLSEYDIVQ